MMSNNTDSKYIYMNYGGNKSNMGREGMLEDYEATPEEEARWKLELITKNVETVLSSENIYEIQAALPCLSYHGYKGLKELLLKKWATASPLLKIAFAGTLWKNFKYDGSFPAILFVYDNSQKQYLHEVFYSLIDFGNNRHAKEFVFRSLQSDDPDVFEKARMTIIMWGYSGIPLLRTEGLSETLKFEYREMMAFRNAVAQIKFILRI